MKSRRILGALALATRRRLGTFRALKVNNFFLIIALIGYSGAESGVEPKSAYPFILFLLFVLLFPLSSDPLDQVPPSRLALWPLSHRDRLILRLASFALSPMFWLAVILLLFRRIRPGIAMAFLTVAIIVQVIAPSVSILSRRFTPMSVDIRRLVPGALEPITKSTLRQMFGSLDFYLALVLAVGAAAYRWFSPYPDPAAYPILAILIALILGNYAQCLFGRDIANSAMVRYRLLPIRGRTILLWKGLGFLLATLVLVSPTHPVSGLTFGFTALAFGHHASIVHASPLRRWRFSGSRLYIGVIQAVAGIMLGFAARNRGLTFLAISMGIYAVSVMLYGWLSGRRV